MKIDEFKSFVKTKPELIKFVKNGETTWQKLYEIYDLYGEKNEAWDKYLIDDRNIEEGLSKISNMVKNVDVDSIKNHINTAQKAIDFVTDLTTKKETPSLGNLNKGPVAPRPLNKFFED